jgi:tripartite-type tricarboxylate transporter receptor subunit TctC
LVEHPAGKFRAVVDPQALRLAARADELIKNLDHLEGPEVCSRSYRKRVLIGTTGNGSSPHISGVYLEKTLGISATMVHCRGAAPALQALMGRQIDILFVRYRTLSHRSERKPLRLMRSPRKIH